MASVEVHARHHVLICADSVVLSCTRRMWTQFDTLQLQHLDHALSAAHQAGIMQYLLLYMLVPNMCHDA